jgi:poly(A) polymerase
VSTATADALARALASRARGDPLLREARRVAQELAVPLWLVGGYVRDVALACRPQDIDLAAGAGTPDLVRALERAWDRRAFRFHRRGVTTWRFALGSRRLDLVDAGQRGLIEELLRRELTVNAMAYELGRGVLLDPLGGLADLAGGRLRPPRPGVVLEDPLRALRAARFLAQLPRHEAAIELGAEIALAAPALRRSATERVREELQRMLAAAEPQRGLAALQRWALLPSILPELVPLDRCMAGTDRPSVWRHTLAAIALSARPGRLPGAEAVRDGARGLLLRWALLLHDVAKPETLAFESGRPTFHGHETRGARHAERMLRRLRLPRRERRRITRLIELHLRPSLLAEAGAPARGLRRLVRDAGEDLPLLVLHAACDALASGSPDAARRFRKLRAVLVRLLELQREAEREPLPRLLDGHALMAALAIEPGPLVGRLLRRLEEAQQEGRVRTREQALAFLQDQASR